MVFKFIVSSVMNSYRAREQNSGQAQLISLIIRNGISTELQGKVIN